MSNSETQTVYHKLVIEANTQTTDIWLGDNVGYLVQKATGMLQTSLLPGDYIVEFGLGTTCYPISLTEPSQYKQLELEVGPSCHRSIPTIQLEK